ILLGDKKVKAVLVNIFGGIMRCTTIATALLEAYKTVGFNVPLVVRLEGTEVQEGRRLLAESGVDIITAEDLTDAAKKVVAAARWPYTWHSIALLTVPWREASRPHTPPIEINPDEHPRQQRH